MTDRISNATTRNSMFIRASQEALYRAFTDPTQLVNWQVPGGMTAKVHHFDLRVGGGYKMSLFYPAAQRLSRGKTAEMKDRYTARFVELSPPERIVEAITFDTEDQDLKGEMIMEVRLQPEGAGTLVTIEFRDIPPGIRPEDNEAGTRSSLEKLARYVEREGK